MTIGDYIQAKFNLWSVDLPAEFITLELYRIDLDAADDMTAASNVDEFFYKPYEPAPERRSEPDEARQSNPSAGARRQVAVLLGGSGKS